MSRKPIAYINGRRSDTWLEQRLDMESPALKRALARLAWRDSWDDSPSAGATLLGRQKG